MKAIRTDHHDCVLLVLHGDFDAFVVRPFRESIDRMLAQGVRHLVLNMRLVKFVTSSAIGTLVRLRSQLLALGGELRISQPSLAFCETIAALGLEGHFPIHDDDQLALGVVA